jgi:serine/threonine protein kinase
MTNDVSKDLGHERRLHEVLLAYVEQVQEGRPPDRRELLAAHPDLGPDLEEFFASHDEMERLAAPLRHATTAGPDGECVAPELGQLGDFRLLREVGRGGMGVVYEAEQISLRRRVALKVLPFAAAIDPRQLQRFQNEALAAAHLRHENIVPVHAVGSERGVHYYAMQFVEGQSVAALIAELRHRSEHDEERVTKDHGRPDDEARLSKKPSDGNGAGPQDTALGLRHSTLDLLSSLGPRHSSFFRTVADLGRQAALALEHAHQMGVIHRDIKPANLLLDVNGQLWVADFGLAQFSSDAGLTLTGELLGTMRYASPEQVLAKRGLVDHRADVYALGATLYELLTLRPPFGGRDRHELLRQIADEEPRPPRSLQRAIPAELETIILKALAKEPGERYATAQELADDLQRFREDRPIHARRPTMVEKATKWARRHRSVVASAVAALLLTLAGLVAATLLIARAYERERQKVQEADEQRVRAEDSFRNAREAVDRLVQIAEEELAGKQDLEWLRWRLLDAALSYYQDFIDQHPNDSSIQTDLEAGRTNVRMILGQLATLVGSYQYLPLHWDAVHDELQLTQEQRQAIADMGANWMQRTRETFGRSPEEREQRRLELARAQEVAVAQLLTPAQYRRFKEIARQFVGPLAFSEPEVAEALQLTSEQKKQMRAIQDQAGPAATKFGPRGSDLRKHPEASDTAERRTQEKILGLLTPEQRRKWNELTGEPFSR